MRPVRSVRPVRRLVIDRRRRRRSDNGASVYGGSYLPCAFRGGQRFGKLYFPVRSASMLHPSPGSRHACLNRLFLHKEYHDAIVTAPVRFTANSSLTEYGACRTHYRMFSQRERRFCQPFVRHHAINERWSVGTANTEYAKMEASYSKNSSCSYNCHVISPSRTTASALRMKRLERNTHKFCSP